VSLVSLGYVSRLFFFLQTARSVCCDLQPVWLNSLQLSTTTSGAVPINTVIECFAVCDHHAEQAATRIGHLHVSSSSSGNNMQLTPSEVLGKH
jgi:hypothetical protein